MFKIGVAIFNNFMSFMVKIARAKLFFENLCVSLWLYVTDQFKTD